ncbi:MAG: hypothetical protein JWP37_2745 [Mucilaginibacter sp.]|nr:hypothetical protein [Mucilaginibacter sp.]
MKKIVYIAFLIVSALAITVGCKKPFMPSVISTSSSFLVVEGIINTGQDSTIIKLSRTVSLSSTTTSKPELNAIVTVESDANATYPLTETGNGSYAVPGLNLSADHKYRLDITTSDNVVYQSDFVPVKNAPPIDSVNFIIKSDGLNINVNTHDPANKTIYYRWTYDETWIIHSFFDSKEKLILVPFDTIVFRPLSEQIYECWQSHLANVIVLGSSAKLKQDIITQTQLTSVGSTSEKLSDRYSILVNQYALTEDAYNYWQQLKKNTEQLGSIFDAQPSEIIGNIHRVGKASEPVLGYISAGSFSQSRIFIDNRKLPAWAAPPIDGCPLHYFPHSDANGIDEVKTYLFLGFEIPITSVTPPGSSVIQGYTASYPNCVDCTLRGSNKRPSFWIDD